MTAHSRYFAFCLGLLAALFAHPAAAEDTALLIQLKPDGRYTVWHAGGQSPLSDDEIGALEAGARPEGGKNVLTSAGLAPAFETPNGVLIRLPALGPERALLIDHDGCGGASRSALHSSHSRMSCCSSALAPANLPVACAR